MKTRAYLLVLGVTLAGAMTMLAAGCDKPAPSAQTHALAPSAAAGPDVNDIDLSTRVTTALANDPVLGSYPIAVVTLKGDVRLTGIVDTQEQIDRAAEVARVIPGVHSIHDELTLRQ
jgi:hyperosmotically inducible periplasmic protein